MGAVVPHCVFENYQEIRCLIEFLRNKRRNARLTDISTDTQICFALSPPRCIKLAGICGGWVWGGHERDLDLRCSGICGAVTGWTNGETWA
jgi:hypothetical protein